MTWFIKMKVSGIDIGSNVEKIKQQIEADTTLSPSMRTTFDLLLLIVTLLYQRLGLNSSNSSKPPSTDLNRKKNLKIVVKITREDRRAIRAQPYYLIVILISSINYPLIKPFYQKALTPKLVTKHVKLYTHAISRCKVSKESCAEIPGIKLKPSHSTSIFYNDVDGYKLPCA
jgi:hypothetical protein